MKLKNIEFYLQAALDKCRAKEARRVSDALKPVLPDVIKTLHSILLDKDADLSTRRWAIDTISGFWSRLLSNEQGENRIAVKRTQASARAKQVKIDETKTALKVHQVRAETDKKLAGIGGV
jgi:hypothetical protein